MAQFASDAFGYTEDTTLATANAAWTLHTSFTGAAEISAGRVRVSGDVQATVAYWHSGTPATANYSVSADLFFKQPSGGPAGAGVIGRVDTAAHTFYYASYFGGSADAWELHKRIAGTNTLLGSSAQAITDETSHNVTLRMVGTTIELYKQGGSTATISVTDSDITAAGKSGIRFYAGSTVPSDTVGIHIDNFSADDIGGGAVSITGADTLAPALTETPTLLSASTLADSLTPALAEAAAVQAALSGADTLTPALTEAATLLVALSGADTLTPALAETAILLGLIDRLDTLTPALSESASLLVAVGASDALTPSLADLATLLVALDATDTLTPALTEALDLLARLDRGDALTPALIETATLLGLIERADTLTPTLAEAAALLAALDATDTLTPNLAEAAAVLVALSATDTLTPALADTAAVLAIIGLAATPALQFVVPAATRGFIIPAPGRAFDIQPHRHAA